MSTAMQLFAIAPTQFGDDARSVDAGAMAENMARIAASGIGRVLLTGSYGEFPALEDAERLEILRAVRRGGAASEIMACAATSSTEGTARLAVAMLDAGADLVMVSPPLACETTERDVLRHFETLSRSVGRRLVVYNNPAFGHDLEPRVLGEVMAMDGYVAIKQGSRDAGRLLGGVDAIRATGRPVRILMASDVVAAMTLTADVDGLTSTNSWVFPEAFRALVEAASRGDAGVLRGLHAALAPYRRAVAGIGQPAAVKAAMRLRGYAGSAAVRGPYAAADGAQVERLRAGIAQSDERVAALHAPQEALR